MNFRPLAGKKIQAAADFIKKHETACTQLASRVRRLTDGLYTVEAANQSSGRPEIVGLLSMNQTVLHCLPFAYSDMPEARILQNDFTTSFTDFSKDRNILCVNGEEAGTSLILKALADTGRCPGQINSYNLLALTPESFAEVTPPHLEEGCRIIRCRAGEAPVSAEMQITAPAGVCSTDTGGQNSGQPQYAQEDTDFGQLFALQKQYEIEEVVPGCRQFDEASCRLRLLHALRTQYIEAVVMPDGEYVSKAGISALGFSCAQLGGVYTAPQHRRRNYARTAVYTILERITRSGKQAVLFAKTENSAANALYSSLGFKKICGYTIAYFNPNL